MRTWLKKIIKDKQITVRRAAELCCISATYMDKILNGKRNVPVKTAKKIAAALGFDWNLFFEEE